VATTAKQNVNAPVELPPDLLRQYQRISGEGAVHQRMLRLKEANESFKELYELLLEKQPTDGRYHKGGPLHLRGITYLYQENPNLAIRYFILAYIEDLLSKKLGEINRAEAEPAALTLRGFGFKETYLTKIKKKIVDARKQNRLVQDPSTILNDLEQKSNLSSLCRNIPKLSQKRPLGSIQSDWSKRVFVGGNYNNPATLYAIKETILREGFDPILAIEFDIPESKIHHHTLMLLHSCRLAVFDVSFEGGHLMEIERLRDYGVECLLVYGSFDQTPPRVSAMLKTIGYEPNPYTSQDALIKKVGAFLREKR